MSETSFPLRREFLRYMSVAFCGGSLLEVQQRSKFPSPPRPTDPNRSSPLSDPQALHRAQLKVNEKEFRESLASLFDRVSELKQDMETTNTAEVFSVKVYKQTGEIEHLAKKLRSLAKI